jgi:hypothetical protein
VTNPPFLKQFNCIASSKKNMLKKHLHLHAKGQHQACCISRNRIIGPIFFDETFNSERYSEVILYSSIGHLSGDEIAHGYFRQDGSIAYAARVSMALLRHVFASRIISKDIWSPRSPILHPLIIICGEQWRTQFTKTILTQSFNWRKPPQIPSGTSLLMNCRVSLQTR